MPAKVQRRRRRRGKARRTHPPRNRPRVGRTCCHCASESCRRCAARWTVWLRGCRSPGSTSRWTSRCRPAWPASCRGPSGQPRSSAPRRSAWAQADSVRSTSPARPGRSAATTSAWPDPSAPTYPRSLLVLLSRRSVRGPGDAWRQRTAIPGGHPARAIDARPGVPVTPPFRIIVDQADIVCHPPKRGSTRNPVKGSRPRREGGPATAPAGEPPPDG